MLTNPLGEIWKSPATRLLQKPQCFLVYLNQIHCFCIDYSLVLIFLLSGITHRDDRDVKEADPREVMTIK